MSGLPITLGGHTLPAPTYRWWLRLPAPPHARRPTKPAWRLPATANATRKMTNYAQNRGNQEWKHETAAVLYQNYPLLARHALPAFFGSAPAIHRAGPVFPAITVLFVRHSVAQPDYDGLVRSFKAPQDGLVLAGLVPDDKPSCLLGRYWWLQSTMDEQRIELLVWPGRAADVPSEPLGWRLVEA